MNTAFDCCIWWNSIIVRNDLVGYTIEYKKWNSFRYCLRIRFLYPKGITYGIIPSEAEESLFLKIMRKKLLHSHKMSLKEIYRKGITPFGRRPTGWQMTVLRIKLSSDIVNREIVSILFRNHYYWESNFCEVRLYYTAIVCIVGFSFFTHEEVKSRTNWLDKSISTVTRVTWVGSISYIFCMFASVNNNWIDTTGHEPLIYHSKIVVSISWSTSMMILSFSSWKAIPFIS